MHVPLRNLLCVLAIVAAGWLVWGSVHSSGQAYVRPERVRWEYRIEESTKSPDLLNRLGREGWELVAALQIEHDRDQIVYQYILKRAR